MSDGWDMHETSIKKLEALKIDEFQDTVNNHFALLEGRLGQGGATIMSEVQTLRATLDSLTITVGSASNQLQSMQQDISTQQSAIAAISSSGGSGSTTTPIIQHRGIMEYKSISNLRPLKAKGEFRLWHERLVTA